MDTFFNILSLRRKKMTINKVSRLQVITSEIESAPMSCACAYESDGEDEANVFNVSGSIQKVTQKHLYNYIVLKLQIQVYIE